MSKKRFQFGVLAAVLAAVLTVPAAVAGTFTGKLNGHNCAHHGKTCPVDRLDPHLALEPDLVLQQGDGDYLFLRNVPRSVKIRHALKNVRVTGDLNERYGSVMVDEFQVKEDGSWETVWSQEAQQAEVEYLRNDGFWFVHN